MKLVGLVSCYKEGRLVQGAIRSALEACDHVAVFEGPAGEHLEDVPESDFGELEGFHFQTGEWTTDAAKRTAMVKWCRGYGSPTWGVWIDGDEVLVNGWALRDALQAVLWRDEEEGGKPSGGFPLRLVEMDGSLAVCRAKCVRVDLIDRYLVSSSGIRFKSGAVLADHAEGNLPQKISEWYISERVKAIGEDRMMLEPPLPCEPFLVHRSPLRHPLRRKLRMHEQEARELRRLGILS